MSSNRVCAVTGSFDPFTKGHLDLVKRALNLFDSVVVLMLENPDRAYMFDESTRSKMAILSLTEEFGENNEQVKFFSYDGFAVDFLNKHNINFIVRGIKNKSEFEYEKQMADYNKKYGDVETLFLDSHLDVSGTLTREKLLKGEDLTEFLSDSVIQYLKEEQYGRRY